MSSRPKQEFQPSSGEMEEREREGGKKRKREGYSQREGESERDGGEREMERLRKNLSRKKLVEF